MSLGTIPHMSQCKEDWKQCSQLTSSLLLRLCLNAKRIESNIHSHPDTDSGKGLNAKRIEREQWYLCWSPWKVVGLNAKRIERSIGRQARRVWRRRRSQCKEDWKLYSVQDPGLYPARSQCKEDWKFPDLYSTPHCPYSVSMQRGLKVFVGPVC